MKKKLKITKTGVVTLFLKIEPKILCQGNLSIQFELKIETWHFCYLLEGLCFEWKIFLKNWKSGGKTLKNVFLNYKIREKVLRKISSFKTLLSLRCIFAENFKSNGSPSPEIFPPQDWKTPVFIFWENGPQSWNFL